MYSKQSDYEAQLRQLGLVENDAFTFTCSLPQVGNESKHGEILSWAKSSAVVYANSVLGARCNRNSGILELFGSIAGCVPKFGLLTDEGRIASWVVEVKTSRRPEAQILGRAIGSLAAAGAILAGVWSENPMPTVDSLGEEFLQAVKTGDPITVEEDGTVTVG